jgi:hypothetical protein
MSFSPILPSGGLTGWIFLQRTAPAQQEIMSQTQSVKRLTDTFKERIGDIKSAEALVEDRELLTVALSAFGLGDDIDNKFYIKKVLEGDTSDPEALVNRLTDKRYLDMAEAFGFGDLGGPSTGLSSFANKIVSDYETKEFASRVGEIDQEMRLALSLKQDLGDIATGSGSNDAKWFTIMGNPPLREVFEVAFGLPAAFGTLPIDKQLEVFKDKSQSVLKTDKVSDFLGEDNLEKLTNTFLIRSQVNATNGASSGSIALTLLQSAPRLFQPLF